MIHNLSLCSLFIELYLTSESIEPLAIGTAFTIKPNTNDWFLITNWHCVTGRHAETNTPLSAFSDPEIMKVYFHQHNNLGKWEIKTIKLLDEKGNKTWLEHPKGNSIDIIAIKLNEFENIDLYNLSDSITGNRLIIDPGDNCSIIGFPNGLTYGGKFPIWKTGHIATDYHINWDNQPMFYIDATTRKGMSGSPVVAIKEGLCHFENNSQISGKFINFLGVYSGRVDESTEIGRVWKPESLIEIIENYYQS